MVALQRGKAKIFYGRVAEVERSDSTGRPSPGPQATPVDIQDHANQRVTSIGASALSVLKLVMNSGP